MKRWPPTSLREWTRPNRHAPAGHQLPHRRRTVGTIVARVEKERLDAKRFDNLYIIGIDEISYRWQHECVTVVVDHAKNRVVWTGKWADTLKQFFAEIGPERTKQIQTATDMSGAFISALNEVAPHVTKVFDRFHVQALASDTTPTARAPSTA